MISLDTIRTKWVIKFNKKLRKNSFVLTNLNS